MTDLYDGIYKEIEFGHIEITIRHLMDEAGITRNKMSKLTGIKYDVVTRYYNGTELERVDLTVLSKICYVLKCDIADIMQYKRP
ncbi:helix-turn-helix transcriptional regulator [Christensenellaceae bacterium OttesenSCG-928-K19]|nr:helix-turn-helix transcriptional regulator [Christensenellaceae bacterium OttesenSCG-928-K19]